MTRILRVPNEAPYESEHAYNALRLTGPLCAKDRPTVPKGDDSTQVMPGKVNYWLTSLASALLLIGPDGHTAPPQANDPVAAPPTASLQACADAQKRLNDRIRPLAAGCTSDDQCEAAYIRPHTCDGPAVIRAGSALAADPELSALGQAARAACKSRYERMPACAPIPSMPRCIHQTCVDAHPASASPRP